MSIPKTYRFSTEITQMCFVFGETKEVDEETVQLIEDLVRSQLTALIISVRNSLQSRGSSSALSIEDLLFHLRNDKEKVNRLRIYLGWKDVRKKSKDSNEVDEAEDNVEDQADKVPKSDSRKIPLPWELTSLYAPSTNFSDEEDDQDDIEVYELSKKRLKQMDDFTQAMTKDEYLRYADSRQASFTYRKAKKFKEFVNISAYMEGTPSVEVADILGFLAYELVRTFVEAGQDSLARKPKPIPSSPTTTALAISPEPTSKAMKKLHYNRSVSALPIPLAIPISLFSASTAIPSVAPGTSNSLGPEDLLKGFEGLQEKKSQIKEFGMNKFGRGKGKRRFGLI